MKLNLNEEIQGDENKIIFDNFIKQKTKEIMVVLAVVLLGIILANI